MMHCSRVALKTRKIEEKKTIEKRQEDKRHFTIKLCYKKSQITSPTKVYR
jgi:hypothetical protein